MLHKMECLYWFTLKNYNISTHFHIDEWYKYQYYS